MAPANSKELSGTLRSPDPSPIIHNIPFLWLPTPEMCVVNISIAVCNLLYLERSFHSNTFLFDHLIFILEGNKVSLKGT